jgi:hypothetical protein
VECVVECVVESLQCNEEHSVFGANNVSDSHGYRRRRWLGNGRFSLVRGANGLPDIQASLIKFLLSDPPELLETVLYRGGW